MSVREEIESAHARELIPALSEEGNIARERHRIARNVNYLGRMRPRNEINYLTASARTRRVENDGGLIKTRPLGGGRFFQVLTEPVVDTTGLGMSTEPLRQVLRGVVRSGRLGFDRGDLGRGAKLVAHCRSEEANATIEIQVGCRGVKQFGINSVLHCRGQHLGGAMVNLPEPGIEQRELTLPYRFGDDLRLLLTDDQAHAPRAGVENVNAVKTSEVLIERCASRKFRGGERQVGNRDDSVRSGRERTHVSVFVNVQADAGAPSESLAFVVAGNGFDDRCERDLGHALERLAEDLSFEFALVAELNVAEFGSPGTVVGVAINARGRPDVLLAVFTRRHNFYCLRTPERLLFVVGNAREHPFSRDRVGDEHDTAVVPRHTDTPVRNVGNVYFDHLAKQFTHPLSIGAFVRLYLASTSPARLATLRAAGVDPVLLASGVDEDAVAAAAPGPLDGPALVDLLARAKAEAVVGALVNGAPIDGFILGGDSAFELDGELFGKPHEPEIARQRWHAQRGRTGVLHSGHWLIDHRGGKVRGATGAVSSASVSFAANISDAEIDAYVATGEPLKVAGSFTIDSLGAAFIESIQGDPHAVVGLSVSLVRQLMREFDAEWTDLWNIDRPSL